jgi:hypothetical protein
MAPKYVSFGIMYLRPAFRPLQLNLHTTVHTTVHPFYPQLQSLTIWLLLELSLGQFRVVLAVPVLQLVRHTAEGLVGLQ